ncbi:LysR family transcriptional regulator [Sporolactobacillus pectinivorans]|uniref:LysR family transcriptional regulator n=1 Tax=Sporolactobacillus pectinivorans TaxID=1591408 RepID=UPI000C258B08|nr:LysR family transcriptional regulator [Sporolactobacillus pectinivorans]
MLKKQPSFRKLFQGNVSDILHDEHTLKMIDARIDKKYTGKFSEVAQKMKGGEGTPINTEINPNPAMTIDQLNAFLAVAESQSYQLAAKELMLSQSTISSRIKTLERELNADLFVKERLGLHLSVRGAVFAPYARLMVDTFRRALLKLGS